MAQIQKSAAWGLRHWDAIQLAGDALDLIQALANLAC